jgi:glycosyltransferase involved in cell wall biosynthesis
VTPTPATSRIRVAVIADYTEEGWPSMDLVADTLVDRLRREHADTVDVTLVRPPMPHPISACLPWRGGRPFTLERIAARHRHYAAVALALGDYDVYHIVDHTYAHLVHELPPERTLVTCHDTDAFRSVLQPDEEWRPLPFRWMSSRILDGLRSAAHVACDSEATRDALENLAGIPGERLTVVPNGADPGGSPDPDGAADFEAARLLGPRRGIELLHVGSTIARKRLDVLLDVFATVRMGRPDVRLVRVGGPFTAGQRIHARDLGVLDAITVLPFVDRMTLMAVYRRAALALLPSEREGFGLPLVEALACGTPVVASDIPVLREVGGPMVAYCPVGDVMTWTHAIHALLEERARDEAAWDRRRRDGLERAAQFSWSRYAAQVADLYAQVAGAAPSDGSEGA